MKTFLKVLAAFVVLLIISGALLVRSVNSDSNKDAIREAVLVTTGYELTIAGDMDIDFFPSLGLVLNDVRLKNPAYPQELASTSAATLKIDLGSIIGGDFIVQELSTDDFYINYFIDASGNNIWEVDQNAETEEISSVESILTRRIENSFPEETANSNDELSTLSFERLRISNASADIQDLSTNTNFRIRNLDLDSRDSNLDGRPFDIDLTFDFLNNGMSEALPIGLSSNIVADINNDNITMSEVKFNVTPMLIQGDVAIENFVEAIAVTGNLQSNDFDIGGLLETLNFTENNDEFISSNLNSTPLLRFGLNFSANENELSVPSISASLGDASIEGDASVRFATDFLPANISYDIRSTTIDLSPFINEDEASINSETEATGEPSVVVETELPLDFLNTVNLIGSISIESLIANQFQLQDINIFTNVEDGLLDIEIQPIQAYDGNIQGNVRIDARRDEAELTSQLSINQVDLTDLVPEVSRFNSVTGRLNLEVDYTASGNTTSALMNSISGSTGFEITENSVDIGVIKQVFTAIAALSPGGDAIQQWPDVIQFAEFAGYILMEEGIKEGQQVKLRMDNFDITGTGGIDIDAGNFNYDLLFTVLGEPYAQTIQIDELYHDVSWPVQCSAAFSEDVSQYCGPDFTQVRTIFSQIGGNAIRSRLNEVLTDQLPTELQDSARGLLRNLFDR
ncbi:MAG: AsmA family protein [Gammaproteobacteria bacterium]|jgi:AsmA protein|nr:AsmA family protein [Gammaproteobacteria bacterium]MBT3858325.1 AsmA family protein [Gammaproteobacteria bacterium]MBT3988552.1 AsmA family protein [Gammaproteobacteria bacterium]MBT4257290.1 AsmA family protein [Gammaproteobacteria bacterium]MBT4580510.1 AsmA family protein [Gammaproteobacteria bacterium]